MKKFILKLGFFLAVITFFAINISSFQRDSQALNSTLNIEMIEVAGSDVVCQCKPFWHNTCKSRAGGQTCGDTSNCREFDDNC